MKDKRPISQVKLSLAHIGISIGYMLALCGLCVSNASAIDAGVASRIEWRLGDSDLVEWQAPPSAVYQSETREDQLIHIAIQISEQQVRVRTRQVTHYPSVASAQEEEFQRMTFDPEVSKLLVYEAAVISSASVVKRFDPAKAVVDQQEDDYVFTNYVDVMTPLPGLARGATKVLDYEVVTERDAMHTPWSRTYLAQTGSPRGEFRLTIEWTHANLRPLLNSSYSPLKCTEKANALRCTARDIPPARTDVDVYYLDELPQIQIAERRSWDDLIQQTRASVDKAGGTTALLQRTYSAVTGDSDDSKLAVFDFVSRDIRYVSYSQGEHAIVPHDVDTTIRNQYGDCKDKSTLLIAMLAEAGIDAHPVLVATDRSDATQVAVPAMSYFDHMAVCTLDESGAPLECLDPTVSNARGEGTTYNLQGRVALPLVRGSTPVELPRDNFRWRVNVDANLKFDLKGGQTETLVRRYNGPYATVMRSRLSGLDSTALNRQLKDDYHNSHSSSADPAFQVSGLGSPLEVLQITSNTEFKNVIALQEQAYYSERLSWARGLMDDLQLSNEVYGYNFPGLRAASRYTFELPERWQLKYPGTPLNIEGKYGTLIRKVVIKQSMGESKGAENNAQLEQHTVLEMPARRIRVSEFPEFSGFLETLGRLTDMKFTVDAALN